MNPVSTPSDGELAKGSQKISILVADDEQSVRKSVICGLIGQGYFVDEAVDGVSALQKLQTQNYNLLITDNSMPKMPGLHLVKYLRSIGSNLPVILMSASIPENLESLKLAATLQKPFATTELQFFVHQALAATDSSLA